MPSVQLTSVHLGYPLRLAHHLSLKKTIVRHLLRKSSQDHRPQSNVYALNDISLEFSQGERWSVIGHNGSGKSSLLKVIAGIYKPTRGTVHTKGRINAMFTPALGFNNALSGRENIFYKGILLGLTIRGIRSKLQKIIDFSELDAAIHLPMYTYSAGMRTRLALAIALYIESDILLFDEIFGSLDHPFMQNLSAVFKSVVQNAPLTVIVSHSNALIRQFSSKTIWLTQGQVSAIGDTDTLLNSYAAPNIPGEHL
jgi:ABC-type polysaccharide/polyol phosphate transport system ATPase subunit